MKKQKETQKDIKTNIENLNPNLDSNMSTEETSEKETVSDDKISETVTTEDKVEESVEEVKPVAKEFETAEDTVEETVKVVEETETPQLTNLSRLAGEVLPKQEKPVTPSHLVINDDKPYAAYTFRCATCNKTFSSDSQIKCKISRCPNNQSNLINKPLFFQ